MEIMTHRKEQGVKQISEVEVKVEMIAHYDIYKEKNL